MTVAYHSERNQVLQYLCDVMATSADIALALKKQRDHPITVERIVQLCEIVK